MKKKTFKTTEKNASCLLAAWAGCKLQEMFYSCPTVPLQSKELGHASDSRRGRFLSPKL